jgi:hypothetical protein
MLLKALIHDKELKKINDSLSHAQVKYISSGGSEGQKERIHSIYKIFKERSMLIRQKFSLIENERRSGVYLAHLWYLVDDKYSTIDECWESIACNEKTPSNVLDSLSNDTSTIICACVARNKSTPKTTLVALFGRKDDFINKIISKNPNTPIFIKIRIMLNI